ncbi:hypothetical protein ACJJIF_21025 [Microbulbifer sp. SSSA002]|uniref:hypothetical protein n=1 Tax=unclassified Microbulbifer TaxID=2619833 RepID=UPI0040392717
MDTPLPASARPATVRIVGRKKIGEAYPTKAPTFLRLYFHWNAFNEPKISLVRRTEQHQQSVFQRRNGKRARAGTNRIRGETATAAERIKIHILGAVRETTAAKKTV